MLNKNWFLKFHNDSQLWVIFCRSFFIVGISVWFGALVFFALGAGISFQIAKSWKLTGINPDLPTQLINYRTIGGAITSQFILRLNMLETVALLMTVFGILLAWIPEHNRNWMLMVQTLIMATMGIFLLIYSQKIGVRMSEIQTSIPIDFSIEQEELKSSLHREFDSLHKQYSRFVSFNAILAFAQLILFSINPLAKSKIKK
jgi:hypothetical protein